MNDAVMPHIDYMAKLELEAISDILIDDPDVALIALQQFLAHVHVLRTRGLESETSAEYQGHDSDG